MPLGQALLTALGIAVTVVAGLSGFGILTGKGWASAWLVGFTIYGVATRLRGGDAARAFRNALERVNGSTAGLLDTITNYQRRGAPLTEDQSRQLCVSLLSRLKETASIALSVGEGSRMRVTLAVPYASTAQLGWRSQQFVLDAVRIWCYDQPYSDRQRSIIPLSAPGAGAAFRTRRPQVLLDVERAAAAAGIVGQPRRYKSVASVPVVAGGAQGEALAVVNFDVVDESYFTDEKVEQQLLPLVAPLVNLIGVVLMMRPEALPYGFDH